MNQEIQSGGAMPAWVTQYFGPMIRAWHGEARLAPVFWLGGVLPSLILIALFGMAVYYGQTLAEQILLVVFGLFTVWIVVSIWRCSEPADTLWPMLARFLTVAWALNAIMVLLFLELDLLTVFAGISG